MPSTGVVGPSGSVVVFAWAVDLLPRAPLRPGSWPWRSGGLEGALDVKDGGPLGADRRGLVQVRFVADQADADAGRADRRYSSAAAHHVYDSEAGAGPGCSGSGSGRLGGFRAMP